MLDVGFPCNTVILTAISEMIKSTTSIWNAQGIQVVMARRVSRVSVHIVLTQVSLLCRFVIQKTMNGSMHVHVVKEWKDLSEFDIEIM